MQAQNVPQFPIQWVHCSQGLPEGATPGYKQRLHVMSWTVPPCRLVTQRGKLFGLDALCAPCQLLIIDQFWFITLPQSVMGRSDCSIIKNPHFGSPPPPFFKIFFFGPRPSLQKITNANTNTKIISDDKRRQKRWLAYFSSRDDYKSDTLLTAC